MGIVDAHSLMRCFAAMALEKGAQVAYKSAVSGLKKVAGGYRVTVRDGRESASFTTKVVINCTGLGADKVAGMVGIDVLRVGYQLHYCRGEYFSVTGGKSRLIRHLVYPVPQPDAAGLGVHVTLDMEGGMRLGPDARYVDTLSYEMDDSRKTEFYESAHKYLPFLKSEDLTPYMCGIRPKLQASGGEFRDFVITDERERGLPCFINLVGIESPGLTASPAIARYVGGLVEKAFQSGS